MGMSFSFRRLVPVFVRMSMRVIMACGWGRTVAAEVMMIVTMRRRRNHRLRNPPLFANLCPFRHFIVVFVTAPLSMRRESFQRGLIHVTREGNLGVAHT